MLKIIHGVIPFLFLIALLISIVRAALDKIPNTKKDIFLTITLIFAHIQLLIGLVLLIPMATVVDWSRVMGNEASRFLLVEHPLTMLIAVVLITLGKVKAKKIEDNAKANKTVFGYFAVALILIVLRTPWEKLF
ncbi:MAG TPA: hypothetical protein EYQ09_01070 [Flavobacteriales bacterium]|jgi:hypothetical protein|nr:hypothetical protein [Flavobacteriales bacterium]